MPDIFTAQPEHQQEHTEKPVHHTAHHAVHPAVGEKHKLEERLLPHMTKEKHSIGLFSHYCANPSGVKFINQEENEVIVVFLRKHFITNVPWIFATLVLLLLPIPVVMLFDLSNFSLFSLPPNFIPLFIGFYYLVVLNFALVNFIIWFYHVGIVTQKRLLDLDVYNILNHHLAETNLPEIVDVSYSQRGFFQSFLDYGNIPIQTEAIKANFEFELAPKPAVVSDIITDLRPYAKGEK